MTWAVSLPLASARGAAELRLEPGIEVLETADAVWLRGRSADERLEMLLRRLPNASRLEVLATGELRPIASRLPHGKLPDGTWTSIKVWAKPALPSAAFAARCDERVPLRIVRTNHESGEANVLLTLIGDWLAYGETAPQIRLDRLRFAVSSDDRVVLHGLPLPPLRGERFYEREGIALPCGWNWSPAVELAAISQSWALSSDDLALVWPDNVWERIDGDQFMHATRSAIRRSARKERA